MGKIIAVANQKGGVGKTTTSVNTAASLQRLGKRTLLADCDPQSNATTGVGVDYKTVGASMYDVLVNGVNVRDAVVRTAFCDLLPSHVSLSAAEIELVDMENREYVLKKALGQVVFDYDYIIIDCPPSLGLLTLAALVCADSVLIPIQCEYYALEGLSQLMNTVKAVKKSLNRSLEIEGILMTMYDSRTNLSAQVCGEVKRFFGALVYPVVVPRNVRISEAPSHGKPVFYYDRSSKGADCYIKLAERIVASNP